MATHLFPFRRHSGEGRNPGGRGWEVKGWQVLADAGVRLSCLLSFPLCGNGLLNHWIPACAGMTKGAEVKNLLGIAKGLSG